MRLRKVHNAEEILKSNEDLVKLEAEQYKGKWHKLFHNDHPIHIEIGMGKGQFITEMAKSNPDINYIGIEVVQSVIIRAVEKQQQEKLKNVMLLCVDASILTEVFEKGEIGRIYLNFSDPWPKNRHEKRRLTFHKFLNIYKIILDDDGEIHFKTDNQKLFEYSIESMSRFNMVFTFVSLNLHQSDFEGNIMTEYEVRFYNLGQRIYRLEAKFKI